MKEKGVIVHKPVIDGACQKCHSSHYAGEKALLKTKRELLCNECHSNQGDVKFVKAHGNIPTRNSDCLGCHEPHIGKGKGLLHRLMHAPFEKGECKRCHERL